ncbi:hypothetical protein [Variovorax guangxiensis]|uniref:Uncharacterized protein n=1 Tax=Variovorax guangxiensis TaxID=1775474 RepID=A0A840FXJ7_9BURK|nr:hypothetical protein [Variovorax guangxiensis]MBB4225004.1 hypothetical protein [Variovorax guangxiensis]
MAQFDVYVDPSKIQRGEKQINWRISALSREGGSKHRSKRRSPAHGATSRYRAFEKKAA